MSPTMMANEQRNRLNQIGRLGQRYARFEKFSQRSLIVAALATLAYVAFVGLVVSEQVASLRDFIVMLRSPDSDPLVMHSQYFLCAIALWAVLALGGQAQIRRKITVLLAHYVPLIPEWHQALLELAHEDRLMPRQLLTWVREEACLLQSDSERA
ncbi:hypothetical protein [Serratia ureilytica]|uniref:hypothetical protein n=1 Tax=Serratia ureilytica TaxID=300181 RepID=UPI00313AE885|nr:hypothetical protein SMETW2_47820 [Serratia marcescens]